MTKHKCELEANEKVKQLCDKYDQSIERLLLKLKPLILIDFFLLKSLN